MLHGVQSQSGQAKGVSVGSEFVREGPTYDGEASNSVSKVFSFPDIWLVLALSFVFCRFSYLHLILTRQSFSCDDIGEGHLQIVVFCE